MFGGIDDEYEDEDWDDDDGYAAEESLEQSYRERPNVRRLTPRRWAMAVFDSPSSNRCWSSTRVSHPYTVPHL